MTVLDPLRACILGLIHGLTEWLPVGSQAHLVFASHFLHLYLPHADAMFFNVVLHGGALLALAVYFYREILLLLRGLGLLLARPRQAWREPYSRLAPLLLVGALPAGIAYAVLQQRLTATVETVPGMAAMLLVTAALLFWVSRHEAGERTLETVGVWDAVVVGCLQAVALLPGLSRLGVTLSGSLLRGLDREAAPRFSVLLTMPVLLAAGIIEALGLRHHALSPALPVAALAVGFVAAATSGYAAVALLLYLLRRGKLAGVAFYCVIVGLGMMLYWQLLVPKLDITSVMGVVNQLPAATFKDGELTGVKIGQQVRFELDVPDPGVGALTVTMRVPVDAHHGQVQTQEIHFRSGGGKGRFSSEELYRVTPIGEQYALPEVGETREILVILRGSWGIENCIRIPLRVLPESQIDRTA